MVHPKFSSVILVLGFALALAAPSFAQGVFKCNIGGKTTYQSTPCSSGGQSKEITIQPGPTEEQIEQAKQRANADKAHVATMPALNKQHQERRFVGQKYDCAALNQQRAEAFGRRNATIRSSRSDNIDRSGSVGDEVDRIQFIESQMIKGGCKPT